MKCAGWIALVCLLLPATPWAQAPASTQAADTTQASPPTAASRPSATGKSSITSKLYFGGTVGFNFGDFTRISVNPLLGYRFTPKLSGGVKVGYEYVRDKRYAETYTSHNFGGSAFGRFRFVPQLYGHVEFATIGYELPFPGGDTEREWVPFLLVGGGYVQRIAPRTSAYVEVLFDVLQDSKSPYEDWEPWFSVGVSVGF
jgi:hypothetical protein